MSNRVNLCGPLIRSTRFAFTVISNFLRWPCGICRFLRSQFATPRPGVQTDFAGGPLPVVLSPARAVRPQLTLVELSPEFGYRLLTAKTVSELGELFPPFLNHYRYATDLASSDPSWTAEARAVRAFRAGFSARRVLQGHFHLVAKSLSLPWDNQYYIALRTRRHPLGWCTSSFELYVEHLVVDGQLEEGSISHGFPSLSEVEIYLRGAQRQWPCELNHLLLL